MQTDHHIKLGELQASLENLQDTYFNREKILRQSCPHAFGQVAIQEVASRKAVTSSWAAHTMAIVWERIKNWIAQNNGNLGLARRNGAALELQQPEKIQSEMNRLIDVNYCFPTSHLRASASAVVDYFLEQALAECKTSEEKQYNSYAKDLKDLGSFWFRRSPEEQLWTGMHTALSAHFKMAETCASALEEWVAATPGRTFELTNLQKLYSQATTLVTYVATCHLQVLHGVESYVWDHAGTEPRLGFVCSDDGTELLVADKLIDKVSTLLQKSSQKPGTQEPRIGCPAFMAMTDEGSVMKEVQKWCLAVVETYYWPAVCAHANRISKA